jgi:hypothetical protein
MMGYFAFEVALFLNGHLFNNLTEEIYLVGYNAT